MGARTVLAGLRPGVVSSLIQAGADIEGLRAAIDLDAAFELLEQESEARDDVPRDAPERSEEVESTAPEALPEAAS